MFGDSDVSSSDGSGDDEETNPSFIVDNTYSSKFGWSVVSYNENGQSKIRINSGIDTIEEELFRGRKDIIECEIPDSVERIGESAFANCINLQKIYFSAHNETYVYYALDDETPAVIADKLGCSAARLVKENALRYPGIKTTSKLQADTCLVIPNKSHHSRLTHIDNDAFHGCTSLKHVRLPDSVEFIGRNAFSGCTSLNSIQLPGNLTFMEVGVFENCYKLTHISIPRRVDKIPALAFHRCKGLKSAELSSSLVIIDGGAFSGCKGLTYIKIPDSVEKIDVEAFANCTQLRAIHLPDNLRFMGQWLFKDCTLLESIDIPEHVSKVHEHVFLGCTSLREATIRPRLSELLEGFYFDFEEYQRQSDDDLSDADGEVGSVYGSSEESDGFISEDDDQRVINPKNVTRVKGMFVGCSSLKTIYVDERDVEAFSELFSEIIQGVEIKAIGTPDHQMHMITYDKSQQLLQKNVHRLPYMYMPPFQNPMKYTKDQKNWIALVLLAAYAASKARRVPMLSQDVLAEIFKLIPKNDSNSIPTETMRFIALE